MTYYKNYIKEKQSKQNLLDDIDNNDNVDDYELSIREIISSIKLVIIIFTNVNKDPGNQTTVLLQNILIGITMVNNEDIKRLSSKAIVVIVRSIIVFNNGNQRQQIPSTSTINSGINNGDQIQNIQQQNSHEIIKVLVSALFATLETESNSKFRSFLLKTIKELLEENFNVVVFANSEIPL